MFPILEEIRDKLFVSPERKWEVYMTKQWRIRYEKFNQPKYKRVKDMRYSRDFRKAKKLKVGVNSVNYGMGGSRRIFNNFWNIANTPWYQIMTTWLFWITVLLTIITNIVLTTQHMHINVGTILWTEFIFAILLVVFLVANIWFRKMPSKKTVELFLKTHNIVSTGYRKQRRNR